MSLCFDEETEPVRRGFFLNFGRQFLFFEVQGIYNSECYAMGLAGSKLG
jgi:hypothetical protein